GSGRAAARLSSGGQVRRPKQTRWATYRGNVTHCSRKIRANAFDRLVKGAGGLVSFLWPQACAATAAIMAAMPASDNVAESAQKPQKNATVPAMKTGAVSRCTTKFAPLACTRG